MNTVLKIIGDMQMNIVRAEFAQRNYKPYRVNTEFKYRSWKLPYYPK